MLPSVVDFAIFALNQLIAPASILSISPQFMAMVTTGNCYSSIVFYLLIYFEYVVAKRVKHSAKNPYLENQYLDVYGKERINRDCSYKASG